MTLTEVAFELGDVRHPLCRVTKAHAGHAVYRIADTGELTRRHRGHVTWHGGPEGAAELVRDLRASRPDAQLEVLHQGSSRSSIAIDATLDAAAGGIAAVPGVLAQHKMVAAFDPVIAREGQLRVRFVVPRVLETPEVLRALQDVQRSCGFSDFRVQRISRISVAAHVESARRSLPPEQESLLALAASMGYYATPKIVTLEEIARSVGLSISPVHKRLKAAEEAIVAQYVGHDAPGSPRRRSRAVQARVEPTSPWELQMRVRGDVGPARALAGVPNARASLHVLSADAVRGQLSLLVVQADAQTQEKLLASLPSQPEVTDAEVVDRSDAHVAIRLVARDRGAYSLSYFHETWGHDACLRSVGFENGEAHLRALLLRPHSADRLQQRLAETARAGSWVDWDVTSVRSLADAGPPPAWPDPLTPRQLEVLRVAHALGYYRTPRTCTLEHVAGTLGVSANAIHKNLVLAESKLIAAYLASGS